MSSAAPLHVRTYGTGGPTVIVVHGGPAAPGTMRPVAEGLADAFRVLEPWQHGGGPEPLSVARHVADLLAVIKSHAPDPPPALVGHSWGAMLVLATAAAHPEAVGPLVLVGCGTFDPAARARMHAILAERTDAALRQQLEALDEQVPDPAERLARRYALTESLYAYDPVGRDADFLAGPLDVRAHQETWQDMLGQQAAGVYPAAFTAIRSPVLMLHGTHDPHPGELIRASLQPHILQLAYAPLPRCGHSPWHERYAREAFFTALRDWLHGDRRGE